MARDWEPFSRQKTMHICGPIPFLRQEEREGIIIMITRLPLEAPLVIDFFPFRASQSLELPRTTAISNTSLYRALPVVLKGRRFHGAIGCEFGSLLVGRGRKGTETQSYPHYFPTSFSSFL